jgi:hypothetical protein
MIRLKKVAFVHPIARPSIPGYAPPDGQMQWEAGPGVELQLEGPWLAVWTRGAAVPRLVPVMHVKHAEPLETPKGFEVPKGWTEPPDQP